MSKKNEAPGTLDDFEGWDSDLGEIDFFGEETVILEKEDETNSNDGETSKKEDSSEEELFSDFEGQEDEKDENVIFSDFEKEETKEKEPEKVTKSTDSKMESLNLLKNKGYIDFDLEEGEELSDLDVEEILEDGYERSIEKRVEELFNDLPSALKQLNKYALDGGNVEELLSRMTSEQTSEMKVGMSLSDEKEQESVLFRLMKEEGIYDDEESIKAQITAMKDSGHLEKVVKAKYSKWENGEKQAEKERETELKQRKERLKESRREYKRLVSQITDKGEARGFKLSRKDKNEIPSYVADETVKLQDGRMTTQMQHDIAQSMRDPEKVALLAKILKSDFDFSIFERKAKTEVVNKERESIRRNSSKTPSKSSGRSSQTKSLADYF